MSRKTALRAALITLPLVAALLYIALNWYRVEQHTVFVGAGPEARKNAFLAYERLLERMGAVPRTLTSPSQIAGVPETATLVVAGNRLAYMTPQRVRQTVAWVQRGGTLVVQAEGYGIDDPLLDALGVERKFAEQKIANSQRRLPPSWGSAQIEVPWPGEAKPLRVTFGGVLPDLQDRRLRSDPVVARAGDLTFLLSFGFGQGRVTIVPRLAFLANDSIGKLDHARLGWRIAGADRPGRVVALFTRLQTPPLLGWVRDEAWAVAIGAALLVAAWLARIVPRFGPLAPEGAPVRRSLREHIVASGRYLWSRGERAYLLEALRERVARAAARRGAKAPPIPQPRTLDAIAFTEAAARLQDIESGLALRARRTPVRKVRP